MVGRERQEGRGAYVRAAYLAGSMRGLPKDNFPEFFRAAKELRKQGWVIISPAEMDTVAKELPSKKWTPAERAKILRRIVKRDIDAILSLRAEKDDAIILLPKWKKSKGTNAEVRTSDWLGLKMYQLTWKGRRAILKQLETLP